MTISYNTNKETGEQEYSGDILVMGIEKKEIGVGDLREIIEEPYVVFSIPLLDVRDGGFIEEEYQGKNGKIYKKLVATGVRLQAETLIKESNKTQGSKFIPNKQKFHF